MSRRVTHSDLDYVRANTFQIQVCRMLKLALAIMLRLIETKVYQRPSKDCARLYTNVHGDIFSA